MTDINKSDPVISGEVRINEDDTLYSATFESGGGIVMVTSAFGQKAVPLGNNLPEDVAKALLRELITLEKQMD